MKRLRVEIWSIAVARKSVKLNRKKLSSTWCLRFLIQLALATTLSKKSMPLLNGRSVRTLLLNLSTSRWPGGRTAAIVAMRPHTWWDWSDRKKSTKKSLTSSWGGHMRCVKEHFMRIQTLTLTTIDLEALHPQGLVSQAGDLMQVALLKLAPE